MLVDYLPEIMREIREISCIMQAQGDEIKFVGQAVNRSLDNTFAESADLDGILRFERLFGVIPKSSQSIEERRTELLNRLHDRVPYTYNTLDAMLLDLYGYDGRARHSLKVNYGLYAVTIFLDKCLEESVSVIRCFVRQRIPANMTLEILLVFIRQKDLKKYTHGELKSRTHLGIMRGET